MNTSSKMIIGAVILLVAVFGIYTLMQKSKTPVVNEPIKIGVILPLTGDWAVLGEEVKKGIETADQEIADIDLKFIFEDDRTDSPTALVNAAQKLVNIDKVDVGFTMIVQESRPIAPIFNASKTPLLVLWDSNRSIKDSGEYIFSNGFSTEMAGEDMATYAYTNLGLRKVAIISHIDAWAEVIAESFAQTFIGLGGRVVSNEKYPVDTTDYRTAIVKIKQTNPDGVYFPLLPMNSTRFLTQAKELGLTVPLLSGDALIQDVITEAQGAAEGAYYTNFYTDADYRDKLTKKYKAQYNTDPLDITLFSFGYDGVKKLVEAIKVSPQSIKKGFDSVFGEDRSANRREKIYQVVNGQPAEVQ